MKDQLFHPWIQSPYNSDNYPSIVDDTSQTYMASENLAHPYSIGSKVILLPEIELEENRLSEKDFTNIISAARKLKTEKIDLAVVTCDFNRLVELDAIAVFLSQMENLEGLHFEILQNSDNYIFNDFHHKTAVLVASKKIFEKDRNFDEDFDPTDKAFNSLPNRYQVRILHNGTFDLKTGLDFKSKKTADMLPRPSGNRADSRLYRKYENFVTKLDENRMMMGQQLIVKFKELLK
jgi:hypothetical protein